MTEITAEMAGTVMEVLVSKGEQVAVDDVLVLMESMKMEIPVTSSQAGVIDEVRVGPGDFVNAGDVLVVLK